ncbi:MAG: dihydrofolate reductase [Xanthobacteraceae bacterium]|nr:dihydrofolate reductase [Xanthobacteraceae bacterium]
MSTAAPRPVSLVLIAAVADNGVIGRDNALPFRQSSDLKRFKALTIGKPVLMGRKTFVSIGKPLPGRTNIVVSRDPGFAPDGVLVVRNLTAAVAVAREDAHKRGVNEIAVIGGTGIFAQLMPLADRLEITHVHARPTGDTHFPPIDATQWRAVARSDHPAGPQDEASFSYVTYARN